MYVAIGIGLAVILLFFVQYNALVGLQQLTRNAWADVDVYLKRRAELIPNLVAAVKGYASHEQAVLTAVAEARTHALSIQGPTKQKSEAETGLSSALVRIVGLAESYPELKAGENFQSLQAELTQTEKLLAHARQYYNACVRDFNIKIESFPSNFVSGMMGLKPKDFFELDDVEEREAPPVG